LRAETRTYFLGRERYLVKVQDWSKPFSYTPEKEREQALPVRFRLARCGKGKEKGLSGALIFLPILVELIGHYSKPDNSLQA
jgi:hypothetical protein